MQRNASWDVSSRPKVQNSKSFSRLSSPPRTPTETSRARAATTQGSLPEILLNQNGVQTSTDDPLAEKTGIFSTAEDDEPVVASPTEVTSPTLKAPETFEELPIEIQSLTDRCIHLLMNTPITMLNIPQGSSSHSAPKSIPLLYPSMPYPRCSRTSTSKRTPISLHISLPYPRAFLGERNRPPLPWPPEPPPPPKPLPVKKPHRERSAETNKCSPLLR